MSHHCDCKTKFFLGLAVLALTMWLLYACSMRVRYYVRITVFYCCILMSGFLAMFGAIPTYFYNAGSLVSMACLRALCFLWLDVEIEVRGAEKIKEPVILVSNHQSSLDVLVMCYVCPYKCAAMIKNSLKYVPFFNIAALLSNSIFVNRFNHQKACNAVQSAADVVLKKRLKVWVFPEGTRHHAHGMLPFKKGAFNIAVTAQIPIVPIVISDYRPFYSKSDKYFHSNGKIIAQVLDPVSTEGLKHEDVPALCGRVREEMPTTT